MGRQIKGLLYFYFADLRHSLIVFWTILMSILVVTLMITWFLRNSVDGFMTLSLTGPMYIYCGIVGYLVVKDMIPFAIKRGATRKNIYISLAIFFFSLSIFKSVLGNSIHFIAEKLNDTLGIESFYFLHLAYFTNDTWYHRILIDTVLMFFAFSLMFIIGLIFYRYGLVGGGIFIGSLLIIILTGAFQGWLYDFIVELFHSLDSVFYIQLLGISVIIYALSILLLKRITILKVR